MSNVSDLKWLVNYARKQQIERLNEHLSEGKTIGTFLGQATAEWHLDSLIRDFQIYMPHVEEELKPKPNKLLFWKK